MKSLHQCKCAQTTTKLITGKEIKVEMATRLMLPEVTLNGANPDFLFLNDIAGETKAEQLNLNAKLDQRRSFGN